LKKQPSCLGGLVVQFFLEPVTVAGGKNHVNGIESFRRFAKFRLNKIPR
jgi:hypothetical protein